MTKNKKFISAMVLFIVLGTTLAFIVNNNQPGNLYYIYSGGCNGVCVAAPCESTNNSGAPCIYPVYSDRFCLNPYTEDAWMTTNGK
jgi:hypothetical protein